MHLKLDTVSDIVVIHIKGNINYPDIKPFDQMIKQLIFKNVKKFVFDFTDLPYINSAVIGRFISLMQEINAHEGRVVYYGIRPYVRNIFKNSHLDQLFDNKKDLEEALVSLR